ncbi:MAG: hypothetical protein JST39_17215 [Bacteroidetes bacterium]|nr:hypothetical protein [Bacteroidota bacterium]
MRNLSMILAFAIMALSARAQSTQFYYPDAFYFVKEVDVTHQKDKSFHFDISVRENPSDTLSRPRIYAVQVRKGKEDIIGKSLVYASAAGSDWKKYSVEGVVDPEATRIWLYVAVNGNGDFYFDNLHFLLDGQEQPVTNASFEEKKLLAGYYVSRRFAPDLKLDASPIALDGKQSVRVQTLGQKSVMQLTRMVAVN